MGLLTDLTKRLLEQQGVVGKEEKTGVPKDVAEAIGDAGGEGSAAGVTDRLAGVYQSSFGSSAYGEGPLAVVPVGPESGGSGGGLNVGAIAIIGLLGVGGYMLYKKMKGGGA